MTDTYSVPTSEQQVREHYRDLIENRFVIWNWMPDSNLFITYLSEDDFYKAWLTNSTVNLTRARTDGTIAQYEGVNIGVSR